MYARHELGKEGEEEATKYLKNKAIKLFKETLSANKEKLTLLQKIKMNMYL